MNQNGCILERLVAEMILKDIWLDIKAVQERDPAARSALEVLLLYQGIHALIWHRFAHWFCQAYFTDSPFLYADRDPSGRYAGTRDSDRPRKRCGHRRDGSGGR